MKSTKTVSPESFRTSTFCEMGFMIRRPEVEFARNVKSEYPDIPILLHSTIQENEQKASAQGAAFLLKDSPTLLYQLQQFIIRNFSFGDFVFRMPDGTEAGRAVDLPSLEEQLRQVPDDSVKYHAERNHFSHWLKARTEFWLAHKLRPRKLSDYPSVTASSGRYHFLPGIQTLSTTGSDYGFQKRNLRSHSELCTNRRRIAWWKGAWSRIR